MRFLVSCSWCHETNEVRCGRKVYCWNCGHRGDVPRIDCDCRVCEIVTELLHGKRESRMKQVGYLYRSSLSNVEKVNPENGKKFTLQELQTFVGGYIELVPGARPLAYCNEDGRRKQLPFNALASQQFQQHLVGDVIQVTR
jgi:hypothetical protein